MKEGKYYIHILNGVVKDTESGEDVSKEFEDLNKLGLDLGLDVDGDILYVKNGIATRGVYGTGNEKKKEGILKRLFRWVFNLLYTEK